MSLNMQGMTLETPQMTDGTPNMQPARDFQQKDWFTQLASKHEGVSQQVLNSCLPLLCSYWTIHIEEVHEVSTSV
jgi:hypothetical protein